MEDLSTLTNNYSTFFSLITFVLFLIWYLLFGVLKFNFEIGLFFFFELSLCKSITLYLSAWEYFIIIIYILGKWQVWNVTFSPLFKKGNISLRRRYFSCVISASEVTSVINSRTRITRLICLEARAHHLNLPFYLSVKYRLLKTILLWYSEVIFWNIFVVVVIIK